jgi:hypothetical protein
MGQISGDKARYNRKRRQKIAKRLQMRELRQAAGAAQSAAPAEKKS